MRVGFIGLGAMGRHMAHNLLRAGYSLKVHDVLPDAAGALLAAGARWAASPAEAAQHADVVFTSLPGPAEVESVGFGPRGLAETLAPGAAWIELSTNSPPSVRRLHARLAAQGAQLLDAPVSGGPQGAKEGRLAIWVGGDAATYARCRPLLERIGDRPQYVGSIGAGTIAKLAHNCASFTVQAALAEAFTLGVKAGVEPLALFRALRHGALGRKRTFDRLAEHFLPGRYDPPAHTLRLAQKDMRLALEMARDAGVPLQLGELAMKELAEALQRGWGERDARIAMTLQEERAGVSVRVPEDALRDALD